MPGPSTNPFSSKAARALVALSPLAVSVLRTTSKTIAATVSAVASEATLAASASASLGPETWFDGLPGLALALAIRPQARARGTLPSLTFEAAFRKSSSRAPAKVRFSSS
eukprot:CAMPEP_0181474450 /NCGR_PEP_ID=MMETSP1110-20121109/40664_1 /TAXON_ID=174948 /ORGANISM="Symbiodinium sp., Strain CCMP421" /LENGTH=109 /DNA_ID=CAMNT_0023599635 /DNA_START=351 /DNA_END=680 /DNA_ORIENTATION=-